MNILIVLVGLLTLLIILLCIPVEIEVTGNFSDQSVVRTHIIWLFGLLRWRLVRGGLKQAREQATSERSSTRWIGLPEVLELLLIHGMLENIFKLVKRLAGSIKTTSAEADLRLSLGDDYDTGMLFGWLLPLQLYVQLPPQYSISLQPSFEEDLSVAGNIHGDWQARPVEILAHCLAFACTRPAGQAIVKIWDYRCRKRH